MRKWIFYTTILQISTILYGFDFYRSPISDFPSGHKEKDFLEKHTYEIDEHNWLKINFNNKKLWLRANNVISAHDLYSEIKCKEDVNLLSTTNLKTEKRTYCQKNHSYKVMDRKNKWLQVLDSNNKKWWVNKYLTKRVPTDLGFAYLKHTSRLYKSEDLNQKSWLKLKSGQFLKTSKYLDSAIEVEFENKKYYVAYEQVISLRNFSLSFRNPQREWVNIWQINNNLVSTPDDKKIKIPHHPIFQLSLNTIIPKEKNLKVYKQYLPPQLENTVLINKKVTFYDNRSIRWGSFHLRDHGKIFWPMHEEEQEANYESEYITSIDFFKKEIFDIASAPFDESILFASANGVYKSYDNRRWHKIPLFNKANHPILFTESGKLLIGSFISEDLGQSFEPYFRWHQVYNVIDLGTGKRNKKLRLTEIHSKDKVGDHLILSIVNEFNQLYYVETKDAGKTFRFLGKNTKFKKL